MSDPLSSFPGAAPPVDPLTSFPGEGASTPPAPPAPSLGERFSSWLNKPRVKFEQLPPEKQAAARTGVYRDAAAIGDLVLMGLPQLALGVMSNSVGRVVAASYGASRDEANAFGKEYQHLMIDHPLFAPFQNLVQFIAGKPENAGLVDKVMQKFDELRGKGGKAIETYTGGAVKAADFEVATDALMLYLGEAAKTKVFSKKEAPRVAETSPQDPLRTFGDISKKYGGEEPSPAEPHTPTSKVDENLWSVNEGPGVTSMTPRDLQMNAKEIAYRMMREGASKAKVESFINRNKTLGPLVAKEMEAIRARRGDVTSSRLGIVIQGEVLDALKEAPKALEQKPGEVVGEAREINKSNSIAVLASPEMRRIAGPAVVAAATAGAYLYGGPQDSNVQEAVMLGALTGSAFSGRGRSVAELRDLPSSSPMAYILEHEPYTNKTLDRLPQNRFEYTREQVLQQVNRPDVSKAEREVMLQALGDRERISAKDLMLGVREATGNFELKSKVTDEFADYGLESIGRDPYGGMHMEGDEVKTSPPTTETRTVVYQSPMELGTNNHFNDPNYFAHARSFDEGGVRHVVELQSDLVQRAAKDTPDVYKQRIETELTSVRGELLEWQKDLESYRTTGKTVDGYVTNERVLTSAISRAQVRIAELESKLNNRSVRGLDATRPLFKDWYKRIVREELAQGAGNPVRFATADTVAKVEGWPNRQTNFDASWGARPPPGVERPAQPYSPEHQGIYDRYKKDVEKFLKKDLGGKEYTDEHGHTWIEVETPKRSTTGRPGGPTQMFGGADPKLLARIGLIGGGALLAAHMVDQNKLEAAIAGGAVGAIASLLPGYASFAIRDVADAVKGADGLKAKVREAYQSKSTQNLLGAGIVGGLAYGVSGGDPVTTALASGLYVGLKSLPKAVKAKIGDLSIDDTINLAQGEIAARERETGNLVQALKTAVPDAARRAAISRAVESGSMSGLSEVEAKAARAVRDYYKAWGEAAKDAGVIQDLIENYVSHLVEKKGSSPTFLQGIMATLQSGGAGGASTFTPHSLARKYDSFEALQKALADTGLQVKTLDIAEIVEAYGKSMGRAIENKRLFTALEAAKEPDEAGAKPLIMDSKTAPASYVRVDSPQLRGKLVHPNMADALKFYAERGNQSGVVKALLAASLAQKRLAVGGSLFHASNLAAAHVAASGRGALDVIREVSSPLTGKARPIKAALDVFRSGGAGDAIDTLIKGGLRLEGLTDVDPASMQKFGGLIDHGVERVLGVKTKGAETALGALEKLQRETFDKITWDYMHTGMKALTAMRLLEEQMAKHPELSKAEVAKQVSSFVNDTYGGLNWQRVMTESQTQLGRWLAQGMLSRPGRTAMQILMFAPDWTLSTFRAAYKALPGATDMPIARSLHQAYVLRSALMYFGLMNAFNIAMSGHPIWENNNPLMLETEDGRRVQIFKHAMEGAEWVAAPTKTLAGKLGFVPKEIAAQLSHKEYLGVGAPEMQTSRLSHAAKGFIPFAGKGVVDPSKSTEDALTEGALGALGVQIYGRTEEQKAADRERRRSLKKRKDQSE